MMLEKHDQLQTVNLQVSKYRIDVLCLICLICIFVTTDVAEYLAVGIRIDVCMICPLTC